jgi:hypothetical protein
MDDVGDSMYIFQALQVLSLIKDPNEMLEPVLGEVSTKVSSRFDWDNGLLH